MRENKVRQNNKNFRPQKRRKSFIHRYKWDYILFAFCIIVGGAYYIDSLIRTSQMQRIETTLIDFGTVESFKEKNMVVIRNDKVLEAPADGYYELIYPEGDRVKKGLPVAKSKNHESTENYNYLIDLIDNRIQAFNNSSGDVSSEGELNKINNRLEYLYKTAQGRIQNDEIEYVEKIKKEIISLNDKKQYFFPNEQKTSKEDLIAQKEKLLREKNNKNSTVYSSMVGLVSSYYDGYEGELNILNIKNLTVSKLEKVENTSGIDYSVEKKKGEPVAVISENFEWYLACEVFPEDIDNIPSGKPIYVEIEDKRFKASLEDFYKGSDDKFVGYFRITDDKFNYYSKRKFDAKLIFQSSNGLAIPNEAIIDLDGKEGVFVVDITGVARFVPIEDFSARNKEYTGIVYDPAAQKSKNVVKLYDEVILNPKGMREGQRVK